MFQTVVESAPGNVANLRGEEQDDAIYTSDEPDLHEFDSPEEPDSGAPMSLKPMMFNAERPVMFNAERPAVQRPVLVQANYADRRVLHSNSERAFLCNEGEKRGGAWSGVASPSMRVLPSSPTRILHGGNNLGGGWSPSRVALPLSPGGRLSSPGAGRLSPGGRLLSPKGRSSPNRLVPADARPPRGYTPGVHCLITSASLDRLGPMASPSAPDDPRLLMEAMRDEGTMSQLLEVVQPGAVETTVERRRKRALSMEQSMEQEERRVGGDRERVGERIVEQGVVVSGEGEDRFFAVGEGFSETGKKGAIMSTAGRCFRFL